MLLLSPSKSARNALIISDAIKHMPDQTVVRADWDNQGRPYLFFSEQFDDLDHSLIKAANIRYHRMELANMIASTVEAIWTNKNLDKNESKALICLKALADNASPDSDYKVGDLKQAFSILSEKQQQERRHQMLMAKTSPHRFAEHTRVNEIIHLRLKQFVHLDAVTLKKLDAALFTDNSELSIQNRTAAITAMQTVIAQYLQQENSPYKPLQEFLNNSHDAVLLRLFARHWQAALKPKSNNYDVMQINIYSWSKELNVISTMILKQSVKTLSPSRTLENKRKATPRYRRSHSRINVLDKFADKPESRLKTTRPASKLLSPSNPSNPDAASVIKTLFQNDDADQEVHSQIPELAKLQPHLPVAALEVDTEAYAAIERSLSEEEQEPLLIYQNNGSGDKSGHFSSESAAL